MQEVTREGGDRLLEVSSVEHVRLEVVAGEGGAPATDETPPAPLPPTEDAPRPDDIMVSGAARHGGCRARVRDCAQRASLAFELYVNCTLMCSVIATNSTG